MRIIIVMLTCVTLLTGCLNPFKAPLNEQQDIKKMVTEIEKQVKDKNWKDAEEIQTKIKKGWAQMRKRVYLNAASDDISELEISFAQLSVYVKEKDRIMALSELEKIKQLWEVIAKL